MLCPAVSDPFYGRLYRICGMIHQVLLIPVIGKFIVWTSYRFKLARPNEDREVKVFGSESNHNFDNGSAGETDSACNKNVKDGVRHRNGMLTTGHVTGNRSNFQEAGNGHTENGFSKQK